MIGGFIFVEKGSQALASFMHNSKSCFTRRKRAWNNMANFDYSTIDELIAIQKFKYSSNTAIFKSFDFFMTNFGHEPLQE